MQTNINKKQKISERVMKKDGYMPSADVYPQKKCKKQIPFYQRQKDVRGGRDLMQKKLTHILTE